MIIVENIGDKLFEYSPKLGEDFTRIGQMAMNDVLRDRVKNMIDFKFSFQGDEIFTKQRIKNLETIINKQAKALLSKEKLYTNDVFFSEKAAIAKEKHKKSNDASKLLCEFENILNEKEFVSNGFISVCDSTDTIQLYFECDSYLLTIDFLEEKINISQNAREILMDELQENAKDFYNDVQMIKKEFIKFIALVNSK